MKHSRMILLGAGLVLAGCGTATQYAWTHRDHAYAQASFPRDQYECQRDAAMVPRTPYPGPAPDPVPRGPMSKDVEAFHRGYAQGQYRAAIAESERATEARANELFHSCMKSRGYFLQEIRE